MLNQLWLGVGFFNIQEGGIWWPWFGFGLGLLLGGVALSSGLFEEG